MALTLAFDVYGTLIDTQNVVSQLQKLVGNQAESFSLTWRNKQLEYSFRRALMQQYADFSVCTREALNYTCMYFDANISQFQKQELLNQYRALPIFDDVSEALMQLKVLKHRIYAFSNGSKKAINELIDSAGISNLFNGVVSVDDIQSFKPDPAVYAHFLKMASADREQTWLVSSNPFDVIGASSAGLKTVWVMRSSKNTYDPWGIEPTITVNSLRDLVSQLS